MDSILSRITVRLSEWSDDVEKWQDRIPFDNPTGFKDYLFREYNAGRIKIIDVEKDHERIGFLAYKIICNQGREFHVLATYIENQSFDCSDYLDALVTKLALAFKCSSLSFSTIRAGLIQKQIKNGFRIAEVVLRKNL
jgi:hypothetical protein